MTVRNDAFSFEACQRLGEDPQESRPEGSRCTSTQRSQTLRVDLTSASSVCYQEDAGDGARREEVESCEFSGRRRTSSTGALTATVGVFLKANHPPPTLSSCPLQEHQQKVTDLVISDTEPKQVVYAFQCNDSTLQVKGKVNAITMGKSGAAHVSIEPQLGRLQDKSTHPLLSLWYLFIF